MKKTTFLLSVIGFFIVSSFAGSENTKQQKSGEATKVILANVKTTNDKVTVCHKPDGKNPHEITISIYALPAHLAHGDTIGSCDDGTNPPVP